MLPDSGRYSPSTAFDPPSRPSYAAILPSAPPPDPHSAARRMAPASSVSFLGARVAHRLRYTDAMTALSGISLRRLKAVASWHEPRPFAARPHIAAAIQAPSRGGKGAFALPEPQRTSDFD